ncbi:hypothetical protein C1H46_040873 [Malus baccata]|uniref:Fe2OG dioxygenase domain-containing protein n=1 Tax=Malus baccata TaxID=106549 RepID=A0A540KHV5_MALBA|nr:hypothetical protein C1H46_040873 [Malus baccata]
MAKLAIVDFSNEDCFKPGTSSWLSIREDICHALDKLGCFVAILPDKISLELRSTFFDTLAELFDFPTEKKVKSFYEKPYPTGYIKVGNAAYESLGIAGATDPEQTQIFEHHFWPNGHNVFRETADLYTKVMEELHHAVTRMVFENYGVEEYLDDHLESTTHMCRFNKYSEPEKTGTNLGLPVHTDSNFSTILYQNHVKGLEIYSKDDEWICIDPLPSSFIFLAGDGFQVWSNDKIRACKHRVILSENVVRHSIGLFSFRVGETHTPKEFIDEDHPLQYKPLNNWEYTQYVKKNASSLGPDYTVKAYCGV